MKDKSAVAVHKEGDVVGHVPYYREHAIRQKEDSFVTISSLLSNFLKRDCNKGFVEVHDWKSCKPWSWIWLGNSLRLQTLWTSALY